jgi:hypothetical protein
LNPKFSPM